MMSQYLLPLAGNFYYLFGCLDYRNHTILGFSLFSKAYNYDVSPKLVQKLMATQEGIPINKTIMCVSAYPKIM